MKNINYDKLQRASFRSAILTILGAIVVISSLIFSYYELNKLTKISQEKSIEISQKQKELSNLKESIQVKEESINKLKNQIKQLTITQESLLDFLVSVTDEQQISIMDSSVDWTGVKNEIIQLPAGKRKDAILTAILLAWKEIPFTMGKESVSSGFDSPRFLRYVLSKVGLDIATVPGERLSDTLMKAFIKVDDPKPGDLVFYKGQVGSFGFIYLSDGDRTGSPVGIGTLQKIAPLQIISLDNINTPYFPLIGYFRVIYPDEK